MQIIEEIANKLKAERVSVLKLSKETGISAYKIYKWMDGKGSPKHEDSKLLEKWLRNELDKVPRETSKNNVSITESAHATDKSDAVIQGVEERLKDKDKLIASKEETITELRERIKELSAKKELEINWSASVQNIAEIRKKLLELPQQLVSGVVDGIVTRVYPSKAAKKDTEKH